MNVLRKKQKLTQLKQSTLALLGKKLTNNMTLAGPLARLLDQRRDC